MRARMRFDAANSDAHRRRCVALDSDAFSTNHRVHLEHAPHTLARDMRRGFLREDAARRVKGRSYAFSGDSPMERFAHGVDAPTKGIFCAKVLSHLHVIELLMLSMTSRAMRACVRARVGDEDWESLHKVKLFVGRAIQMDYSEKREIELAREDAAREDDIDPLERWWLKASRGELERWGLVFSAQTMIDCVNNPPRIYGELQPRGDHDVRHRVIYLRNVLRCPWDDDALFELLVENQYLYTLNWCFDHGCAPKSRQKQPFCLAETFNTTAEEFEQFVVTSMFPEIDAWHIDTSHGVDVFVGTQNPPQEPEKETFTEEDFNVDDLTKIVGQVDAQDMRYLDELGFFK